MPDWIGTEEAARICGVTVPAIRRWADKGEIPHWKTPGGQRRFSRERLATWIAEREKQASERKE